MIKTFLQNLSFREIHERLLRRPVTVILAVAAVTLFFASHIPNLFPILINFGIMGWFGVELSMVTSLIASIAIGLAVDDTIHYLVRFNRELREDLDEKRALRETIRHMGRPIIYTTLTIGIGFSILAFSSFKLTAMPANPSTRAVRPAGAGITKFILS